MRPSRYALCVAPHGCGASPSALQYTAVDGTGRVTSLDAWLPQETASEVHMSRTNQRLTRRWPSHGLMDGHRYARQSRSNNHEETQQEGLYVRAFKRS